MFHDLKFKVLLKAAQQGSWLAQYWIGTFYELGVGVSQNPYQAFVWYTKAAKSGDAISASHATRLEQIYDFTTTE